MGVCLDSKTGEKVRPVVSGVCSVSSAGRDTGGGFLLEDEDEEEMAGERDIRTVEEDGMNSFKFLCMYNLYCSPIRFTRSSFLPIHSQLQHCLMNKWYVLSVEGHLQSLSSSASSSSVCVISAGRYKLNVKHFLLTNYRLLCVFVFLS